MSEVLFFSTESLSTLQATTWLKFKQHTFRIIITSQRIFVTPPASLMDELLNQKGDRCYLN